MKASDLREATELARRLGFLSDIAQEGVLRSAVIKLHAATGADQEVPIDKTDAALFLNAEISRLRRELMSLGVSE